MEHVNGYQVIAEIRDQTSEAAQKIVVCDRLRDLDQYVVWTTAHISGRIEAWQGFYTDDLRTALANATERALP
jgi:hypothetical protein